jgi:hypothetical protein
MGSLHPRWLVAKERNVAQTLLSADVLSGVHFRGQECPRYTSGFGWGFTSEARMEAPKTKSTIASTHPVGMLT